ncbi:helix-turn-helix domain-containing protein [Virgibacillus salexigens]|uniref:Transcriptional regulator n=1 Tax=Virgibacillus kapii TaxID=1638645 RepID=A0ABQ2D9Y8_9BACI|nr:helix-turn-helix transcriptional regulator [Virgibacillus kapii]GGJ48932.1 transcriptional regulator [Virgibacillus kapii]
MNGNAIKKIRFSKGFTQTELAKKLKMDRSYLSSIENNRVTPSIKTLEKIASELGVSLKKFF